MNKSLHMLCALSTILVAGSLTFADAPTESIAGIWIADHDDLEAGRLIKFGDYPPIPPDVQSDLDAFNQSLAQAPVHLRDGWIMMSNDGLGFGVGSIASSDEAPGVWIWPNWRNATPVIFEQYHYFSFVSHASRYVVLYSLLRIEPEPAVVVDLQNLQTIYPLPDVTKSTRYLHVTNEGRWAGVNVARTKLLVGQLDPEHPNAGSQEAEEVQLPEDGRIDNLTWVHDGEFLVVELQLDETDVPKLFVIRGDNLTIVDSAEHAWMFFGGSTINGSSFYGGMDGQRSFITVSTDGELSGQPTGFPKEEEGRERPAAVSPSGTFVLTYWDETEVIDEDDGSQSLMRFVDSGVRATPLADFDSPVPTYPTHEVDGEEVSAGRYFWLSWE